MEIFLYILLFWSGFTFGVIVFAIVSPRLKSYGGMIVANSNEEEDKLLYSLILFDDPENLINEKEVLFKITTSEEEADRE